jgi:hypothetical protein
LQIYIPICSWAGIDPGGSRDWEAFEAKKAMKITLTQEVAEIGRPWKSEVTDVTNTKVEAAEAVEAVEAEKAMKIT